MSKSPYHKAKTLLSLHKDQLRGKGLEKMIFQLISKVCDPPAAQSFLREIKVSQKGSILMGILPKEDPS